MAAATKTDSIALHAVTPIAGYRQATADDVREWAASEGIEVNTGRGRMALDVIHAFNRASKRRKVQYVTGSEAQTPVTYDYVTATGRAGKFTAQPKEVRAWAKDNGLKVGERGRFSQEVRDAYGQAHAPKRKPKA